MRSLALVLLVGCSGGNPYAADRYADVTHYAVDYDRFTARGVGVDGALDLDEVDRRTDAVEDCLTALFPDGRLPVEVVAASRCTAPNFNPQVARQWLGVKLAPDWYRGCYDEGRKYVGPDNGEQKFPADVDPALCEAKGLRVTPKCPCGERAAIQGNSTIVTAPNMHLYESELIRLVTGCNDVWASVLASCYAAEEPGR